MRGAQIEVSTSPELFQPGDDVTFTVSVGGAQTNAAVAGLFVTAPRSGELYTLPGEGLILEPGAGLLHTQPKEAVNGVVTFRFGWRAPAAAGGIFVDVATLAGNGDGRSTGDQAGFTRWMTAFGCAGATHFEDLDRDGYGSNALLTSIDCEGVTPPEGYSTLSGDCNENDPSVHPTAIEKCNKKDDDCDGAVDEESVPVELWPDEDGDGYYVAETGTPMMGCVGLAGYAAERGDCSPEDAAIFPGAVEVCNGLDDNCDGRTDERVLPQCGVGRCRRESSNCEAVNCKPGEPVAELCNLLDDDCNGLTDDGTTCEAGFVCVYGDCLPDDGSTPIGGAGGSAGSGGSGADAGTANPGGSSGGGAGGSADASGGLAPGGTGAGGSGEAAATRPDATGCSVSHRRAGASFVGWIALAALLRARRFRRVNA
jgi:hypothetical protein